MNSELVKETEHTHGHTHAGGHSHGESHENTQQVLNRLSRLTGHLNKVRSMIEEGEDCSDVLVQLYAVKSALNNVGKIILKDHIDHCMVSAIENGDYDEIEKLNRAIDELLK